MTPGDTALKERLDSILLAGVRDGVVAGAIGIVVDRDGVIYSGAAGERVRGSGVAMSPDTVCALHSMTKPITSVAAMQLVERGELSLDAPAAEVCPDIGDSQVLEGFDDQGQPVLRPPASPVTLRNLLTHTSGYVYELWNPDIVRFTEVTGGPGITSREMRAVRVPLMFDPGTRWEYGIGLEWVGLMVEAATGITLGRYVQQHVTEPLGMTDTGFTATPEMADRMAKRHTRGRDATLTPFVPPAPPAPEFDSGGGGLLSTALDYGRFMRMILNNGELNGTRVLDTATVKAMCQNQMGDVRVATLTTAMPDSTNDLALFPAEERSWGLGFQVHECAGSTGRTAGTLSWAGLANTYFWIDRHNGIAGAWFSQLLPFADAKALATYTKFETAVYSHLTLTAPRVSPPRAG